MNPSAICNSSFGSAFIKKISAVPGAPAILTAADLEFGLIYPTIEVNCLFYPVFLRGEGLMQLHRPVEATAEYQKFFDHPTLVLNNPLEALAHLQLASASVMRGDAQRARADYQDFLRLWNDADADLIPLKQAKAKSARLRQ